MINYDFTKDYYSILGIAKDASRAELFEQFATVSAGKTGDELAEINEAFWVLSDDVTRSRYDSERAKYLRDEEKKAARAAKKAKKVKSSEEAEETASKGRNTLKTVGITALVVALIAGAGVIGWETNEINHLRKDQQRSIEYTIDDTTRSNTVIEDSNLEETEVTTEVETKAPAGSENETVAEVDAVTQATQAPEEEEVDAVTHATQAPEEDESKTDSLTGGVADIQLAGGDTVVNSGVTNTEAPSAAVTEAPSVARTEAGYSEVKAFGNALDDAQVTERGQALLSYATSVNAINLDTGMPYTLEEMKNLVLYFNGAYVPENDADAFQMEDRLLSFVCVPSNDPAFVNGIGFMSGNDTIEGSYICQEANFTDMFLMGDSYCYPYLQWLQKQYNTIITSDNLDTRVAVADAMFQSYVDIIYGDGYKMTTDDGREIVITRNDLTNKSRLNDANLFRLYGLLMQPYRTERTKEVFAYHSSTGGDGTVDADTLLEQLNVKCASDIAKDAYYDTEGYIRLPENELLDNVYDRIQTNTITAATDNYYFGNADAYKNSQTLSLR